MSRRRRLLAALVGIALAHGLVAPAARAQCPFQMQTWYQVQMQRWAGQSQMLQAQPLRGGLGLQTFSQPLARPMQPSSFQTSLALQTRTNLSQTLHPSLSLEWIPHPHRLQPQPGVRSFGGTPLPPDGEWRLHFNLTTSHRLTTQTSLTSLTRRLAPGRPLDAPTMMPRGTPLPPGQALLPRALPTGGAVPVVTAGVRFTCAGSCHAPQRQPQRLPQQPDVLQAGFFPLQRPVQPLRAALPPELFLLNRMQPLRQPPAVLAQRLPPPLARVDVPAWLRGADQPALARMLLPVPPPPADPARKATPAESLWAPETTTVDPFAPSRVGDDFAAPALRRVLEAPPPPSTDWLRRLAGEAPVVQASAETEAVRAAPEPPSLESLLEAPPPPPTLGALLPPPDDRAGADQVARLGPAPSDLESLLEPPPPTSSTR